MTRGILHRKRLKSIPKLVCTSLCPRLHQGFSQTQILTEVIPGASPLFKFIDAQPAIFTQTSPSVRLVMALTRCTHFLLFLSPHPPCVVSWSCFHGFLICLCFFPRKMSTPSVGDTGEFGTLLLPGLQKTLLSNILEFDSKIFFRCHTK